MLSWTPGMWKCNLLIYFKTAVGIGKVVNARRKRHFLNTVKLLTVNDIDATFLCFCYAYMLSVQYH